MAAVSISTVPRDLAQLQQLKPAQLIRLAIQLNMLADDRVESAFKAAPPDQKAVEVYNALVAYDQAGGAPAQQAQAPQQPVQPPPQMQAPQVPQPPPQQQMAPPPQFQPPVPPGAQVQQQYQQPPQQQQYQAPPQQQYQAPPQHQPPQQPQFQAPVPPPAVPIPPQQPPQQLPQQYQAPQPPSVPQPPPQQPPQARQPMTASDPGNAGAGQAAPVGELIPVLKQLLEMSQQIGKGVDTIGRGLNGGVQLQRVQLQVLLVLCEQQGIDADDLAKLLSYQDADAVEKFIGRLGGAGKS